MKTIYVVMKLSFEGDSPIEAFSSEEAAKDFARQLLNTYRDGYEMTQVTPLTLDKHLN